MPGKSQVHMLQLHKTQHFLVVTSSSPMTFPWSLLGSIMVFTKSLGNAFYMQSLVGFIMGLNLMIGSLISINPLNSKP